MKRAIAFLVVVYSLAVQAATPGPAPAPGGLDASFGDGGVQYTNFGVSPSGASERIGIALQPDGKVVVAGSGTLEFGSLPLIARFTSGGTLDATFNSGGSIRAAPGGISVRAVALQADGKIVVAGTAGPGQNFGLARFNANGTVDLSFNGTGYVSTPVGSTSSATAVAIQPDGKIVAAGSGSPGTYSEFALVRYHPDGSLDTTFGGTGIVTTSVGTLDDAAHAVAIQADGKIVAGGSATGATMDFAVARYNANGSLDTTFNSVGYATTDFGGNGDLIRGLRIAPDGRIVAAGSTAFVGGIDFAFARYNANGTPDATFNGTGRVSHSFTTGSDGASSVAVLPDGRIVAAGFYMSGVTFVAIVQLTASGALDTSFAGTGKFSRAQGAPSALGAVAVQPDGKVLAAGYVSSGRDLIVLRLDGAGSPDASFGTAGTATLAAALQPDAAYAAAIQADGRIVAVGKAERVSGPDPLALARYNTNGTLDAGFGAEGRVTDDLGASFLQRASAYSVAIQSDGRIVVAGSLETSPFNTGQVPAASFVVARYTAAGSREVVASTSLETFSVARAVRLQGDGKIVAAGFTHTHPSFQARGPRRFALARYNVDLSLDTGFNGTGKVVTVLGSGDAEANALGILPDGRIIAVGTARNAANQDWAMVLYTAAGGPAGSLLMDMSSGADDVANALLVQPDGAILVAGSAGNQAALARFTAPGLYDESFATGGKFVIHGAPFVSLALQADGKVLALTGDFHLWRFTATGVPDSTFGLAGRVVLHMGPEPATAYAVAAQADGRIVLAGTGDKGLSGGDFLVARVDPAANNLKATPSAASLDFGGQSMNTTSPASILTFTSQSVGGVTLVSPSTSPGFAIAGNTCIGPLHFQSCQISVSFTPATQGIVRGSLLVRLYPGREDVAVTLVGQGERSLVTHYFRSILRRDPDAGGKAFWEGEANRVSALSANVNETWYAMAQAFFFSAEYAAFNRGNADFVTDLYNTFFNRAPDSGGLAYWVGNLDQGMPREVLLAEFMFSTEFRNFTQAIFGAQTTRAEVDAVTDFYRGLLARLPDNGGFTHWVGRLRTAQCQGQAAVVAAVEEISSAFALSAEYAGRNRANAQYIGDLYNAFLRRGGDPGGVQFWIDQVTSGARTREQVRVEFKNSAEFQARVNAIVNQGCTS